GKRLEDDAWEAAQMLELKSLCKRINEDALLRQATTLNSGVKCFFDTTDSLGRSRMGGMHIHKRIQFENGNSWLARILRYNFTSFCDEMTNAILVSECATLKWLEEKGVPAPRLHGYGKRNDLENDVGVAYMLIDELPGRPLCYFEPSEQQLRKIYSQYADILCTVSRHPFYQIGSLAMDPAGGENFIIGPISGDRTGTLCLTGPFTNAKQYYSAWAEEYLRLIFEGQLFAQYPVNAYLVTKYLLQLATSGKFNSFEEVLDDGPFFLKHMDDKGDHILVDDEFNITGIIDWTFARIVPVYEAMGPSLVTANMNDIYNGTPGLSNHDKLVADAMLTKDTNLARFLSSSDVVRRLTFALDIGSSISWDDALDLLRGIFATVTQNNDCFTWDRWRDDRLAEWAEDEQLTLLLKREALSCAAISSQMTPRFGTCSSEGCAKPIIRGSDCMICKLHHCTKHHSALYHNCPEVAELEEESWKKIMDDEVSALLQEVNTIELTRIASELNKGEHCAFRPNEHIGDGSMMGCANYHASILFDSGEEWLVRIPRTSGNALPASLVEYLVASEYATLKFLESTNVPAPKAFGYGLVSDTLNNVGVNYLLMERLPGKPYREYIANESQKESVLLQLSHILIEMSNYPFPKAGSLLVENGEVRISAVASNRFVILDRYGPYNDAVEYFSSITDQYLDLIADGQIYPEYPREAFLFYQTLRRHIPDLFNKNNADTYSDFFLKHVDDKGDHILVDENYNITGVIDWQFARVVPACEAFGPSLVTADLNALYTGQAGLTSADRLLVHAFQEQGKHELAEYARESDLARRFHFGLASGLKREDICEILRGLIISFGAPSNIDIENWMGKEAVRYFDDPLWLRIEALELERNT
ncbi:hypothetical protein LOZ41_005684, partial [Ophidiomyces ophidiicola]